MPKRILVVAAPLIGAAVLGGCFSYQEAAAPPPPPAPVLVQVPQNPPPQRVMTYPEGRYELRGDGRTVAYYWVWVPTGTTYAFAPPAPPSTTVVVTSGRVQRTVYYPEGRYELYGDGVTVPYYWVWSPTGSVPPYAPPHPGS